MAGTASRIDAPSRDEEKDRRLLNLLFILNATRSPVPTSLLIGDSDLGYGSDNQQSDERKFRRDRAELAKNGIHIVEVKQEGSAENEESSWEIDRERTHIGLGVLTRDDAEMLTLAIDDFLLRSDVPYRFALKRIRAKIAGDAPARDEEDPVLESLWSAYGLRKAVGFRYRSANGSTSKRTAEAYGFFSRAGYAYMVGRDRDKDAMRTFRIDRIDAPSVTRHSYAVPDEFDIDDFLFFTFDLGDGEGMPARFELDGSLSRNEAEGLTHGLGSLERSKGSWSWSIDIKSIDEAAAFALSHADAGLVPIEPAELASAWKARISEVVNAHERH